MRTTDQISADLAMLLVVLGLWTIHMTLATANPTCQLPDQVEDRQDLVQQADDLLEVAITGLDEDNALDHQEDDSSYRQLNYFV